MFGIEKENIREKIGKREFKEERKIESDMDWKMWGWKKIKKERKIEIGDGRMREKEEKLMKKKRNKGLLGIVEDGKMREGGRIEMSRRKMVEDELKIKWKKDNKKVFKKKKRYEVEMGIEGKKGKKKVLKNLKKGVVLNWGKRIEKKEIKKEKKEEKDLGIIDKGKDGKKMIEKGRNKELIGERERGRGKKILRKGYWEDEKRIEREMNYFKGSRKYDLRFR